MSFEWLNISSSIITIGKFFNGLYRFYKKRDDLEADLIRKRNAELTCFIDNFGSFIRRFEYDWNSLKKFPVKFTYDAHTITKKYVDELTCFTTSELLSEMQDLKEPIESLRFQFERLIQHPLGVIKSYEGNGIDQKRNFDEIENAIQKIKDAIQG